MSKAPTQINSRKGIKISDRTRALYEERNKELDNDPESRVLPPEKWANAMTRPEFEASLKRTHAAKKQTTVRLDADVLEWLKSKGEGHISRVNSILRAVMLADKKPDG